MTSNTILRSRIVLSFVVIFGAVLVVKLFYIQVVHGDSYSQEADRQYVTPSGNIYERGTIFFKQKDGQYISAAVQATGYKLTIVPTSIKDPEGVYKKISEILVINHDDFIKRAKKENDPYEEIANRLSQKEADAITALGIDGVRVAKEKWRSYPGADLASHTLGFVGYRDAELGGRYGLERYYDRELSRNDESLYVNFFAEIFSDINKAVFDDGVYEGDVVTTIEPTVQAFLEKILLDVSAVRTPELLGGIIMNPKDGSIYALGAKPDFDPNDFSKVKNVSTFSNPLVENVLEFGSVVKPLVMAAALDKGVVRADTKYHDRGSVIVEKKEIFNFDKKARGEGVTMQEVLNQSLNTGMVFVEQKLGKENMRDYLLSYGIGEKTGVDLPNETSGLVSNLKSPREIEYANAAFGQGIALSPMAMARSLASLANGGELVVPHVVKEIRYPNGTSKEMKYQTTPTLISPETSEEITRMLVGVMDEAIRGGQAKLENFSIAVKTGTAQVADNVSGGYYEDRHTHSFFGYFPAYDPEFIVFLYAVNPRGSQYASVTWSDPFLDIAKFLLSYYEIPPDR